MGIWSRMLLADRAFGATTEDINNPVDNIIQFEIMLRMQQLTTTTGTAGITKDTYKAVLPKITQKLGGHQITNISYQDLAAINALWLQRNPLITALGTANAIENYLQCEGPLVLPAYIKKHSARGMRENSLQFQYAANALAEDISLDVKVKYQDTDFPERGNLHYEIDTFTGNGAAEVRTNISRAGARLLGILCYSTHHPFGAAATTEPEISELDVLVDKDQVYTDIWTCRGDEHANVDYSDDLLVLGLQDIFYQWISFEKQPWPADDIWAICRNTVHIMDGAAQTGAFRLICVYDAP